MISGFGQDNRYIDSLNNELIEAPDVRKQIEILTLLSKKHQTIEIKEARKQAYQALNLSKNSNIKDYLGETYGSLGDIAIMEDSISLAKEHYLKAKEFFEEQGKHEKLIGVIKVLGNIAYVRDDLTVGLDHYLEAIRLTEEYGFEYMLPGLYINIGAVNLKSGNYGDAIENFSRALEESREIQDSVMIAIAYHNMGVAYYSMNDYNLSRTYLNKASKIYIQQNNNIELANCYINLAPIEAQEGNIESSNQLYFSALDLMQAGEKEYAGPASLQRVFCYVGIGNNYFILKDFQNALTYLQKAYELAVINRQLIQIAEAGKMMSETWKELNYTDSAFYYFRIYKAYSDSLVNEENIKKLAYMEAQFKYEQKLNDEKQERLRETQAEKQNYLILAFVIVGLTLAIIIMILLLKLWRNKVKRAELEQTTLRNELELRNKELTTHVMYQVKNNEFILNISKKLQSGIYKLKPENRAMIEEVIRDIEHDSTGNAWKEFEVRFQRVHTDFYKKLLEKFPDLSANELRLCALLRLNMNTKEIAAITYQTVNSIGTARSRLRQKLGITKDDNLIRFLMQL